MKQGIHPESNYVIFRDTSCGKDFKIRSTMTSDLTVEWEDGETYPLINVDVSSESHPFYTGKEQRASVDGRIDKFNKRYAKKS